VTSPVEQLHYTWAPRGVEGVNRFQIAAMSPGLEAGPAAAAMPMVRRLCRYDPPRGAKDNLPVSFGWLDYEGHRIGFRRVGLPAEMGKRGNFAAHLLVAPAAELPEAAIAATFGSPFWWDGISADREDEGLRLPAIALDEITLEGGRPGGEDMQAGIALAYHLFTKPADARLSVTASAEDLGRAVRVVARLAPGALAGLSFSTYEGNPVFPFDLVGSEAPEPGLPSRSLALPKDLDEGGLLTLDQLAKGDRLGDAATRTARPGAEDGSAAAAIWRAARRIVGLSRGESIADSDDLLADAGVIGLICETADGRTAVAAAVHGAHPDVLAAVGMAVEGMDRGEADLLAGAIADRYRSTVAASGCAQVIAALGGVQGESVRDAVLDLVLESEAAAVTLRGSDAALLLAQASQRVVEPPEALPLLLGARDRIDSCAAVPEVPDTYLAAMFELGLEDPSAATRLAAAGRSRPGFLTEVQLDDAAKDHCLAMLERLDPDSRRILLPAFLVELSADPWGRRLWPILQPLPPAVAAQCVLEALASDRHPEPSESLSRICEELAARLLALGAWAPALDLLERSGSAESRRAIRLLREMKRRGGRTAAVALSAVDELNESALGRSIAELAIERAVSSASRSADVAATWGAIEATLPGSDDEEVLHALMACAVRRAHGTSAAEILGWVADSHLSHNSKALTRFGSLRDAESDALALELAARAPALLLKQMEEADESASRTTRKWWKRLIKSAERAEQ